MQSQSAMEYLMTYGWAILIIAVILGALYQVGVFNPYTFSPKAGAGACKVARGIVDGQVTSSRVGACNSALPQYVAQFDGTSSNVYIGDPGNLTTFGAMTITAWIRTNRIGGNEQDPVSKESDYKMALEQSGGGTLWFGTATSGGWGPDGLLSGGAVAASAWYFIAATYDGSTKRIFINSAQDANTKAASGTISNSGFPLMIGCTESPCLSFFYGDIANIQIYNSSLTGNEILALYKEGIGGDPVNTKNLVGWWQLNGDAKDYSGNGNNGTPTNVVFTGSWTNGYSAP